MSLTAELSARGGGLIALNFSFIFPYLEQQRQEILIVLYWNWSLFIPMSPGPAHKPFVRLIGEGIVRNTTKNGGGLIALNFSSVFLYLEHGMRN
jgi:hypothetical protein